MAYDLKMAILESIYQMEEEDKRSATLVHALPKQSAENGAYELDENGKYIYEDATLKITRKDYQDGTATDCATGRVTAMELKGSNVLRYELADGTTILVRPSGTEPKIKVYILTLGKDPAQRDENIEKYSRWALALQK